MRDVAVVLAALVGAAEDNLVYRGCRKGRCLGKQRPDDVRRQIVRPDGGQRTAVAADRE